MSLEGITEAGFRKFPLVWKSVPPHRKYYDSRESIRWGPFLTSGINF
jgi:hypothetical protein